MERAAQWAAQPLCLGRATQAPVSRGLAAAGDALDSAGPCQVCLTAHASGYERKRVPGGRFGSAGAVILTVSPVRSFSVPSLQ